MRKDFDDCLELIKAERIKKFVKRALAKAPKEFWTDPCSSSDRNHPPEDNVEGGIIVHTRKGIQVVISLCRFFGITDQLVKDKLFAAFILHDIKKNGEPWGKRTDYEHGLIAYRWLVQFALRVKSEVSQEDMNFLRVLLDNDLMDVRELIRDHMGIWSKPNPTPALEIGQEVGEKAIWHQIIQLADYIASREWLPFTCDEFIEA